MFMGKSKDKSKGKSDNDWIFVSKSNSESNGYSLAVYTELRSVYLLNETYGRHPSLISCLPYS